jgi:hypothetical protein
MDAARDNLVGAAVALHLVDDEQERAQVAELAHANSGFVLPRKSRQPAAR